LRLTCACATPAVSSTRGSHISVPGLDRAVARAIVDAAHETCPYSKATRGNIEVVINLCLSAPLERHL
jgi:organic hydroperoxide reductase OsmC/OhrA